MKDLEKTTPVFAAVFAVVYVFAVQYNLALFSYYPRGGQWEWLVRNGYPGPGMYWYGWLATSFLAATTASLAAVPLARRGLIPAAVGWVIPLAVMLSFVYLLRGFFWR